MILLEDKKNNKNLFFENRRRVGEKSGQLFFGYEGVTWFGRASKRRVLTRVRVGIHETLLFAPLLA